jgi:hypothetical protein
MYGNISSDLLAPFYLMKKCATQYCACRLQGRLKALTDHLGGKLRVHIVIRSVLVNWRLGYFFISHFKGPSSQDQKKPLDAA